MSVTLLIFLSAIATYVWRVCGVVVGSRLRADSALFQWLSCVAYALLAGLMSRVLVFPAGVLAETSLFARVISMLFGFLLFAMLGRHVLFATLGAAISFGLLIFAGL